MTSIIIPIDDFIATEEGHRETYLIEEEFQIKEQDFAQTRTTPITFKLTLMRLKEGILASIESLLIDMEFLCSRCANPSQFQLEITNAERIFYLDQNSAPNEDPYDIFFIDKKKREIDLYEMIRQELLLHFPQSQVCSEHCQGLCPTCGIDLNQKTCSCPKESTTNQGLKKLAALKDLFRDQMGNTDSFS